MENRHWLLPEGIDEVLPPNALALERLRRALLDRYGSWGYELVSPPLIEYLESLLTGTGGDLDLKTFKLTDQLTGRTVGVRADITPQVARIDAHLLRAGHPTRLCYCGTVLNTRNDDFGGSRSPLQLGAELYGHAGVESELEILCLMLETLECAAIPEVYLDLGHVGIFRFLTRQAGLTPPQEMALFDALQRKAIPEIEGLVAGFGVEAQSAVMLSALAGLSGGPEVLERARVSLDAAPEPAHEAIAQLEHLARQMSRRRPDVQVHFDLAELRGYHYHTGVVFAAYTPGLGTELARGGRYDDIGRVFGRARPACGFSADLKLLYRLGRSEVEHQGGIFAPACDEPGLVQRIRELREQGRRVVCALPGQEGDARAMGCGETLEKQGMEWIVAPVV